MASEQTVFDVAPGRFEQQVVDASSKLPIVVDFWAEWCAPCRTLGPILEKVVRSYEGRALLAKVNIEKDRETAARYGIQSIPSVMVFRDGRVAAQFVGALPESEVTRILAAVLPSPADERVTRADSLAAKGRTEEARKLYEDALKEDPEHAGALLRLGTMAADRGEVAQARQMLSRIEEDAPEHAAAQAELARTEFAETCRQRGGLDACRKRLAEKPEDLDARYELACCLASEGDYERALEEFLAVVARDRNYRDQAAKDAMLRIFSLVGPRSELADTYRRKLAGVLY